MFTKEIAVISVFLLGLILAQQNEYALDFEKVELVMVNGDYIDNMELKLFKYNETIQAVNGSGTLKKDLGRNIKVNMDASKLNDNNEFKQMTAISDVNMCELLDKNQFGFQDMLKTTNFTVCPWKAEFYVGHNIMIDATKLPPNAPLGKYIVNVHHFDGETEMLHIRYTGSVVAKK